MATLVYDIAIIGAGASGLQLLYELVQADPSRKKKILLLDSGDRSQKSWCFWEDHTSSSFSFSCRKVLEKHDLPDKPRQNDTIRNRAFKL